MVREPRRVGAQLYRRAGCGYRRCHDVGPECGLHGVCASGEREHGVCGGAFTTIGGAPRNRIAALDATIGNATAWNPNADKGVYALAVIGSTAYAGSPFTTIGGAARQGFAAFDGTSPTVLSHTLQASYLGTGPISLTVTFSEDVSIAGGAKGANSATNPDNYRVINKGINGILETAACNAPMGGDDLQVTVSSVTYSPNTALVTFASALPVGSYRLFVCGTTSIEDIALNALAGDGSTAGTDFSFDLIVAEKITNRRIYNNWTMPTTGFAPNVVTALPAQPAGLSYATLGDLWLEIPSQNVQADIVGVPQSENIWNVSWLGNNVGWLNGSAFPTWEGNSILTAHVVNADGSSGPFANLYKLDYGEQIIVHLYDQSYVFQIRNKRLVRPTVTDFAFEHLEGNSYLTLVTCSGYDGRTNTYRYRRLLRAEFVGMK